MSIGQRIKQARSTAGLSLSKLGNQAGVSASAIQKYERDQDVPSSGVLLRLARALDVKTEFFFRPVRVSLDGIQPAYRKKASLTQHAQARIKGRTLEWLESYLQAEELASTEHHPFEMPEGFPFQVADMEDAESAALLLRSDWQLGLDSIQNLTELLEDRGVKVGMTDAADGFDACGFWVDQDGERVPLIVVSEAMPGDRQRFSLGHELGHLLLSVSDSLNEERVCHRFAGALLVPKPTVLAELGQRRHRLDVIELHLLKHKYGLSMQAWLRRAADTGVISDEEMVQHLRRFAWANWRRQEPGDQYPAERPTRFTRLVRRSLVEGAISRSKASELLGKPVGETEREMAEVSSW